METTKTEKLDYTPLVLMEEPQQPPIKLPNFITTNAALAAADPWFQQVQSRISSPEPSGLDNICEETNSQV